jgi:hypothetical protein
MRLTSASKHQNIGQNERFPRNNNSENRKPSHGGYWETDSGELKLCTASVDKSAINAPRNQANSGLRSDWLKTGQSLVLGRRRCAQRRV